MRQAIETYFIGPTDHRGSRVKARCDAGSLTFNWDHSLNMEENHSTAARLLAERFGWIGDSSDWFLVGGSLADRGYAFILVRSTGKVES